MGDKSERVYSPEEIRRNRVIAILVLAGVIALFHFWPEPQSQAVKDARYQKETNELIERAERYRTSEMHCAHLRSKAISEMSANDLQDVRGCQALGRW